MAVQGSGVVGKTIDPPMKNQNSTSPINPRSGAAKHPQTSFPIKEGMKNMVDKGSKMNVGPSNPGSGPDASSPNPLDPSPSYKTLKRQPAGDVKASWGMRDANGQSVNGALGKKILAQAARMGRIDA